MYIKKYQESVMMKYKEKRALLLIVLFSVCGICAGAFLLPGGVAAEPAEFPKGASFGDIKEFVFSLCSSTVAECLLLFASGFTSFPQLIISPIFFFRGCALSYCARSAASLPQSVSSVVSYGVITILMIFIACAAAGYSTVKNKRDYKNFLPFAYTYLLISGASIIVKTVPLMIVAEYINKI